MDIPPFLETQIREGKVVLALGSGASYDAKDKNGKRPPMGNGLRDLLCDKFLGGNYKDLSLAHVSELAISESDLVTVQDYIGSIYEIFSPTEAHKLLSTFSWWGLATTNYDRLIENAYSAETSTAQTVKALIDNTDRFDNVMRDPKNVPLLKLHGCVTRTNNSASPLILTIDQYVQYKDGRSRVFECLRDWGYEHPIVFIGQSLQDPDLREILLDLTKQAGAARPRYYAVAPDLDNLKARFWESRKVTALSGTFAQFMEAINAKIQPAFRKLAFMGSRVSSPIAARFNNVNSVVSLACEKFLENDVEYVKGINATEQLASSDFYKGVSSGWAAIEQKFDVARRLNDTIIADNFLKSDVDHMKSMELLLIKAHAGAGKSVTLKRIAWAAAHDYDCLCLFLRPNGVINTGALQEIINLCKERVFLFVDDGADRVRELRSLASNIGVEGGQLTVLVAERINEWNISCESLSPFVSTEYELGYLTHKEIDGLLILLDKHRALGTLSSATLEERRAAFSERAGRQLLVALHEATLGRRFEDIIEDEYSHIQPAEAQRIYLTICVLNRLNVAVRAGIVSRIHGVPFDDFRKRLFSPLEHIVQAEFDEAVRDYVYTARHPVIAEIVFERVLRNPEERYDAFIKCLRELNIGYSADRLAYLEMIRGRTLMSLFPNHDMVTGIYDVAKSHVGVDGALLHQMAIYEMNRPNGSLLKSGELLGQATQLLPHDYSIIHSLAEHSLRSAELARTNLEKEKHLRQAYAIAKKLKSNRPDNVHGYHTAIKVSLKNLEGALNALDNDGSETTAEDAVKNTERDLFDGLQRFPGDAYLLEAEAQLARLLADSGRVLTALEKAFAGNHRSSFIAARLSQHYTAIGHLDQAKEVLEKALDANRNERRLHYAYAKLLIDLGSSDGSLLAYHLQRAFTPGDSNYDAQLLYGRQLYLNGEYDASQSIFRVLGNVRVGADLRNRISYPLGRLFHGMIVWVEANYCFVVNDGASDRVYTHRNNVDEDIWRQLQSQSRVTYQIGFTLRGVNAYNLKMEV